MCIRDRYRNMDYWLLQTVRDNHTARLHGGRTRFGDPFADKTIDDHVENMQWRYKAQAFKNKTNDWVHHSRNMPYAPQSMTFVNAEFIHRSRVESMDEWNTGSEATGADDPGNKRQSTVAPEHEPILTMMAEIISKSRIWVETPGRKFKGISHQAIVLWGGRCKDRKPCWYWLCCSDENRCVVVVLSLIHI